MASLYLKRVYGLVRRRGDFMAKPKIMKDTKIEYDGQEYENIVSINRSYNYSSFSYLDSSGSEVNVYLQEGKTFNIINASKS